MKLTVRKGMKLIIGIGVVGIIGLSIFNYDIFNLGFLDHPDIVESKGLDDKEKSNDMEDVKAAINKVKETFVLAEVAEDSIYYDNYSNNRREIGRLEKGETVEVIRDRGYEWYLVKSKYGKEGWISSRNLIIPENPETNYDRMTEKEVEEFINYKGFTSDTDYLVWVDIDRQLTHVLLNKDGSWKLQRTILSSTGNNNSPTIKGLYKIQDRGEQFYTERLNSGAKNWVRIDGVYLFHSVAMDKQGNIVDPTLGKRASDGCVRMSLEDSEWFYNNIEENSTVFIN